MLLAVVLACISGVAGAETDEPKQPAPAADTPPASGESEEGGREADEEQAAAAQVASRQAEAAAKERLETLAALQKKAKQIKEFLEGKLNTEVEPKSLFQVDLDDERATRVEVLWLTDLLEQYPAPKAPELAEQSDEAQESEQEESPQDNSGDEPEPTAAPKELKAEYVALRERDAELFDARLTLDRARLAYYSLPQAQREELLRLHRERQENVMEASAEEQLSAAEQKEKAAEKARTDALEAARKARSEGERAVAEESARLLAVASAQAKFEAALVQRSEALKQTEDARLALRRQVQETISQTNASNSETVNLDETYSRVVSTLKQTQDALGAALRKLDQGKSEVPSPGPDGLQDVPAQIDRRQAQEVRKRVIATQRELQIREKKLRVAAAAAHFSDMEALNELRLRLVPLLSDERRQAATSLSPSGLEQALAEARHVWLLLRYHHSATSGWLDEVTRTGGVRGKSALTAIFIGIKWMFPVGIFIWWRRRAEKVLDLLEAKVRGETEGKVAPGGLHRAEHGIQLLRRIRRPLEWLFLIWAIVWFLPMEAKTLLEVQLARTVFTWTLGGTIVVGSIDFLSDIEGPRHRRRSATMTAHLRLRSLRLVGRAVVVFGLIHSLSSLTVGRGTIYGWVFSFLWLAALVILLLLIKWWRHVIFERISAKRKKSKLDKFIAENQTGWKSLAAAIVGGAALFGAGAYRVVRAQVSAFSLTRQVLAYLFQRDMSKQAEGGEPSAHKPLDRERFQLLSPMKRFNALVPSVADAQLDEVIKRIDAPGGGVFAIVGERGSGKTTLVKRIATQSADIIRVQTPFGKQTDFEAAFAAALPKKTSGTLEETVRALDQASKNGGIVVDDAHRLIKPKPGGFEAFDQVLTMARTCSTNLCWVFTFDEVIWRLLQRMRGTKPLFDEVIRIKPWEEDGIVSFLNTRNEKAGIEPSFVDLVGALPEDADEIDYEEALAATEENYLRLLWHYSAGNPGIALHAWRMSLGVAEDGEVRVGVFKSPSPTSLEELPDNALFVLRAIVQLERTSVPEICEVTQLSEAMVQDVVRYGRVKGYVHDWEDGIGISWTWFRAVTKLLQRRHFLYSD